MKPKVKLTNVSKKYYFFTKQFDKLLALLSLKKKMKQFSALRNVSFEVYEGESIGIIGVNGSGKSTLSNILAQIVLPTTGKVEINGDSSLISISAGLNQHLTGIENIKLKSLMLGLKKEEIQEITPKIIEFADIGAFIHQPVKNYSSGMKSRLGFAISAFTNPDIMIIDEALSVGDQTFYEKCLNKVKEFKNQGKTIFFISHSISQMRAFSDRVLWLHFGEVKEFGNKEEVLGNYQAFIKWFNSLSDEEKRDYKTELLQEQFLKHSALLNRSSKKKRKIKFVSFITTIQVFFLIAGLGFSTFFLLQNTGEQSNKHTVKQEEKKKEQSNELKITVIQKEGYLSKKTVNVFSENNSGTKIGQLEFAAPIFIKEKIGHSYLIQFQNKKGYINVDDAVIINGQWQALNYKFEDILRFMPKSFSDSYSFFMAQLSSAYSKMKNTLRGLTNESLDPSGNKVLHYGNEHVSYTFNEQNAAERITIYDINQDDPILNNLLRESYFKSEDDQLYYLAIPLYQVIVNLEDDSITFIPAK